MDERNRILARGLVENSCKIKQNEKVLVTANGFEAAELVREIVKCIYEKGAYPYVRLSDSSITREVLKNANEDMLKIQNDCELYMMKQMDAYIAISASDNTYELSDVPTEKLSLYSKIMEPAFNQRVSFTKWVILRYPNASGAQAAKMSKEAFREYFYNVCCLDYSKMDEAMQPLKELMEKTDKVRITGEGTDLCFSIKGLPAIKCSGESNIPDGELFTAPVKTSVNGYITFNTPSLEQGYVFENIRFVFKDGKITEATCNQTKRINEILDIDEGARYIGEFSFGLNPYITFPMLDTLFDEKIAGSFHFTPGCAYDECDNGNKSALHWDLVNIQTEAYGGGTIYFDDVAIRENGRFVLPQLEGLNPENLK